MWDYEKRLQYPVNITTPNAKLAQYIISQYGGPDGELGASMRYLSQRYATPYREVAGLLTDIGTEELGHLCWKSSVFTSKPADRCFFVIDFLCPILHCPTIHMNKAAVLDNSFYADAGSISGHLCRGLALHHNVKGSAL